MLLHQVCAWPMKLTLGNFSRIFVEILDSQVVNFVPLKMHQHGHFIFLGNFSNFLNGRGIAVHMKLLFGDAEGAFFEPFFNFRTRSGQASDFIGAEYVFLRMVQAKVVDGGVAGAIGFQAVE